MEMREIVPLFPRSFVVLLYFNFMENQEYCLEIANTILSQIISVVGTMTFSSWGVSEKTATYHNDMPSLVMDVNGLLHKGKAIVSYDEGGDSYTVYLLDKDGNVTYEADNIFFDTLGTILDDKIERCESWTDEEYYSRLKKEGVLRL